jgi:hypothetical protein
VSFAFYLQNNRMIFPMSPPAQVVAASNSRVRLMCASFAAHPAGGAAAV